MDSLWAVHTASSLIHERNAGLHEFCPLLEAGVFWAIEFVSPDRDWRVPVGSKDDCAGGRLSHFYPVALPVIATPAVWPAQQIIAVARPVLAPQAERQAGSVRRALLLIGFITASLAVELVLAFAITALGAALAKAEAALERATGSILDANHIFVEAAKQGAM